MATLRVFLAIDETPFFHPQFIDELLSRCEDRVVGAALIRWAPSVADSSLYLRRNIYRLSVREIAALGRRRAAAALGNRLPGLCPGGGPRSVRLALERHRIPYFPVDSDINEPHYVDRIAGLGPDVILSSQCHIFRRTLLQTPRIGCLNRHCSLLPANAGLWPIFHALRKQEPETGVSVHVMSERVDEGVVLSQRRVPCTPTKSMLDLYAECFALAVGAVIEALDSVRSGDLRPVENGLPPSYYSLPSAEQWREFRRRGGRIA